MEQFLYGLLAGIAMGMWLAILLYTVAGRRYPDWLPRRSVDGSAQSEAEATADVDADPTDAIIDVSTLVDDRTDADDTAQSSETGPIAGADYIPPVRPTPSTGNPPPEVDTQGTVNFSYGDQASGGPDAQSASGDDAYKHLIARMNGDATSAARLILYERERAPAAPFDTLVQNALDRLEYGPQ